MSLASKGFEQQQHTSSQQHEEDRMRRVPPKKRRVVVASSAAASAVATPPAVKTPPNAPAAAPPSLSPERAQALSDVEASVTLLPPEDSAAYLQALKECPRVCEEESDPYVFYQVENGDSSAAAKRLARYWTERLQVFGDRAFLPLDLTGTGALQEEEIAYVKTGALVEAPRDPIGRSVWIHDASRQPYDVHEHMQSRVKALFYSMHVFSQNPKSCTEGIVLIRVVNKVQFGGNQAQRLFGVIRDAAPFKLRSFIACFNLGKSAGDENHLKKTAVPIFVQTVSKILKGKIIPVVGKSTREIQTKLAALGLQKEGLPESLGGTWSYDEFLQTLEQSSATNSSGNQTQSGEASANGSLDEQARKALLESVATAETQADADVRRARKRYHDAAYARRKRAREREVINVLETEHVELLKQKQGYEDEFVRLQGLLEQANEIVIKTATTTSQQQKQQVLPTRVSPPATTSSTITATAACSSAGQTSTAAASLGSVLSQEQTAAAASFPMPAGLASSSFSHSLGLSALPAPASSHTESVHPNARQALDVLAQLEKTSSKSLDELLLDPSIQNHMLQLLPQSSPPAPEVPSLPSFALPPQSAHANTPHNPLSTSSWEATAALLLGSPSSASYQMDLNSVLSALLDPPSQSTQPSTTRTASAASELEQLLGLGTARRM